MPIATGSIAFLGAARFQGTWHAGTNEASGSCLTGTPCATYTELLKDGGYRHQGGTQLTASTGDYWQVTGSGTTTVDGQNDWSLNDWCIYSGSAGSTGVWRKLAFEDTIASIIMGDLSASDTFHLTGSADKHVLFISGSTDSDVSMSGSSDFTYDHYQKLLFLTGTLEMANGTGGNQNLANLKLTTNKSGQLFDSRINLKKSAGSINSPSTVSENDQLGQISWWGYNSDGANYDEAAHIFVAVDGEPSTGADSSDMPGRIEFATSPDASGAPSTRMTIKSDGKIGIATTEPTHTLSVTGTIGVGGDSSRNYIEFFDENNIISGSIRMPMSASHAGARNAEEGFMLGPDEELWRHGTVGMTSGSGPGEVGALILKNAEGNIFLDASSNILIGTEFTNNTTPKGLGIGVATVEDNLHISGTYGHGMTIETVGAISPTSAQGAPMIRLRKARGTKPTRGVQFAQVDKDPTPSIVQGSDYIGAIRFEAHDGADYENYGAMISCQIDNTLMTADPSENTIPGLLAFHVSPSAKPGSGGTSYPSGDVSINSSGSACFGGANHFLGSSGHHVPVMNQVQVVVTGEAHKEGLLFARDNYNGPLANEFTGHVSASAWLGGIGFDSFDGSVGTNNGLSNSLTASAVYIGAVVPPHREAGNDVHDVSNKGGELIFATSPEDKDMNVVATERMRIDSSGSVGIGTAQPQHSLSVTGSLGVSGKTHLSASLTLGQPVLASGLPKAQWIGGYLDMYRHHQTPDSHHDLNLTLSTYGFLDAGAKYWPSLNLGGTLSSDIPSVNKHVISFHSSSMGGTIQNKQGYINISASLGINIPDDQVLRFGEHAGHGDNGYYGGGHITYREAIDDYLTISGSANGLVLSGSSIVIDGTLEGASPLNIAGQMLCTGPITALGHGNSSTVATGVSETFPANTNSLMYGPITISDGAILTLNNTAAVKIKDISDL